MNDGLQIKLTATAEASLRKYHREADSCIAKGDGSSAKVRAFRALEEALTKDIPSEPFNQKFALAGCLSSIYRFEKDSLRICYLGHGAQKRIVVLYICEAGPGESACYATFTYMVMSGQFDAAFASLGLEPPNRSGASGAPSIN